MARARTHKKRKTAKRKTSHGGTSALKSLSGRVLNLSSRVSKVEHACGVKTKKHSKKESMYDVSEVY